MLTDLISIKALPEEIANNETIKLVDNYLQWFGRYYCPKTKDISKIIDETYTSPNEQGLIEFKFNPKYPNSHQNLINLFQELNPEVPESQLALPYLFHCP